VRGRVFTRVMTSTFVLPGDVVPARADSQKSLKLGPGLLQVSSEALPSAQDPIIATRAGTLNSSDDGKRWWIEKNVLRVRSLTSICARG
jgi:exosome complex component RRP40